MAKEKINLPNEDLDWIQIRQDSIPIQGETGKEKLVRKFKENPFVPIGCLATASALGFGLHHFRTGNKRMSQVMMRSRVLAQGFTIGVLIIGLIMTCNKKE